MENEVNTKDMRLQPEVATYIDAYIELLQKIEERFKVATNMKLPTREIVKLFDIVFKKTRKNPAVCVMNESERKGGRYDIWLSTSGLGIRSRHASRNSAFTSIKDIIQLRADAKELVQKLYDLHLPQAAKDMEDFLNMLPKFDGEKMFVELEAHEKFKLNTRNEDVLYVDSVRITPSYWGGIHVEVAGDLEVVSANMRVIDKEELARLTSSEFAEQLWPIIALMRVANVPSRSGLRMPGWTDGTIVTDITASQPGWVITYIARKRSSSTIESVCRPRDVIALKQLIPLMPRLLAEVEVQTREYVECGKTIEENLRKRFNKQVLAEAL